MPNTYQILKRRGFPQLLSLVIPLYNEHELVPILRAQLDDFLAELPCPVEVVLVNDGSSDRTLDQLMDWAATDTRIKVLGLARNFGHQIAATAGLDSASGDAVVLMDADLQDPLEVVHGMLAKYCEGYDVVYGQRNRRVGETQFKRITAWAFYRLMRAFVHPDLPADTGDFRLLSRRCLDSLQTMRERHRFLRGMVAWVGFAQTAIHYDRAPRAAGTTKYTLRKMLRFAWTAMVSFSSLPLRASFYAGCAIAILGLSWGGYSVMRYVVYGDNLPGWTSQMVVTCLIGAAILVSNAILGSYVGQIFEEIKERPLYIVSSVANFAADSSQLSPRVSSPRPVLPFVAASSHVLSPPKNQSEAA
ncbi:MAG: glycosyltransferase family 2 protein [Thermoguttaceae bacterium]